MGLSQAIDVNTLAASVLIPLLTGLLSKMSWPGPLKAGITIALSVIFALVDTALSGQLKAGDVLAEATLVITASHVFYKMFLSEMAKALQAVGPIADPDHKPAENQR